MKDATWGEGGRKTVLKWGFFFKCHSGIKGSSQFTFLLYCVAVKMYSFREAPVILWLQKALREFKVGRGVYLYLLNVFCSLGLWVGSCSSSIIKWEKQSREDGNHAVAEQDIYWIKLVWHHLLTGDFACKIIKIQLNCRDLQMKDGNRWIIWHFHGFMT